MDLGWTNLPGYGIGGVPGSNVAGSPFGAGMIDANLPSIGPAPGTGLAILGDAGNAVFFSRDAGTAHPTPMFFSQDKLIVNGYLDTLLTRSDGTAVDYYGFDNSIPAAQRGQLKYYADAGGHVTSTAYNVSGQLTALSFFDLESSEI